MRRVLFGLLLAMFIHNALATTIVVGNCVEGDYEFNDLLDALEEAEDHSDVNLFICGVQELERGKTIHVNDLIINGGTIVSNGDRLRIYGDDIVLKDLNVIDTKIKVIARGDIDVENVNISLPEGWKYCIDVNAEGDVTLIDTNVSGCDYGVYVEWADELNIWSVYTGGKTTAVHFEPENVNDVYMNPVRVVVEKIVEKNVERNVPVQEIVYRVPPEIQKDLDSCRELVGILQKKKNDLENRVAELTVKLADAEKARTYPDMWVVVGVALLGIAVGYLLGRM